MSERIKRPSPAQTVVLDRAVVLGGVDVPLEWSVTVSSCVTAEWLERRHESGDLDNFYRYTLTELGRDALTWGRASAKRRAAKLAAVSGRHVEINGLRIGDPVEVDAGGRRRPGVVMLLGVKRLTVRYRRNRTGATAERPFPLADVYPAPPQPGRVYPYDSAPLEYGSAVPVRFVKANGEALVTFTRNHDEAEKLARQRAGEANVVSVAIAGNEMYNAFPEPVEQPDPWQRREHPADPRMRTDAVRAHLAEHGVTGVSVHSYGDNVTSLELGADCNAPAERVAAVFGAIPWRRRTAVRTGPGWVSVELGGDLVPAEPVRQHVIELIVVPCGGRKLRHPAPAGEMYVGNYHRAARRAAEQFHGGEKYDRVMILSAKHGLVDLDQVIDPYEQRLGKPGAITAAELRDQATDLGLITAGDRTMVRVLGGREYADLIREAFPDGTSIMEPLENVGGIGQQLRRLKALAVPPVVDRAVVEQRVAEHARRRGVDRFVSDEISASWSPDLRTWLLYAFCPSTRAAADADRDAVAAALAELSNVDSTSSLRYVRTARLADTADAGLPTAIDPELLAAAAAAAAVIGNHQTGKILGPTLDGLANGYTLDGATRDQLKALVVAGGRAAVEQLAPPTVDELDDIVTPDGDVVTARAAAEQLAELWGHDDDQPEDDTRYVVPTSADVDELLGGTAEHREVAGWKGDEPGSAGVRCACGLAYDGFDTLAEASELLARHIADPEQPAEVPAWLETASGPSGSLPRRLPLADRDPDELDGVAIGGPVRPAGSPVDQCRDCAGSGEYLGDDLEPHHCLTCGGTGDVDPALDVEPAVIGDVEIYTAGVDLPTRVPGAALAEFTGDVPPGVDVDELVVEVYPCTLRAGDYLRHEAPDHPTGLCRIDVAALAGLALDFVGGVPVGDGPVLDPDTIVRVTTHCGVELDMPPGDTRSVVRYERLLAAVFGAEQPTDGLEIGA